MRADWRVRTCVLAALACAATSAWATTLRQMSLDELAATATVVARVRCSANESRWENGHIYTFTVFEVEETLKGHAPARVTVRLIGGKVGSLASTVDGVPRFRAGEETYLFLTPTAQGNLTVVSWAQGTFRVQRDAAGQEAVTQDTGGLALFDPATRRFVPGGIRRMPVEEFRERVASAVARTANRQVPR